MALVGMSPAAIKPTALILNIVVASIGSFQFWNAGHFSWRLFWPFALLSIPCAFIGGYNSLPTRGFRIVVGLVLLFSAVRFFIRPREGSDLRMPGVAKALPVGAGLGLLAGLTGTGGGGFRMFYSCQFSSGAGWQFQRNAPVSGSGYSVGHGRCRRGNAWVVSRQPPFCARGHKILFGDRADHCGFQAVVYLVILTPNTA